MIRRNRRRPRRHADAHSRLHGNCCLLLFRGIRHRCRLIVTVFGLGGCGGAVYVAESAVAFAPVDWVVTVVSVPQDAPLHPAPESDQFTAVFGFDPGAGVSVATIVVVPPAGTPAGAVSCTVKLLVIVRLAEACFDGSATLCAVNVTLVAIGRIPGAV